MRFSSPVWITDAKLVTGESVENAETMFKLIEEDLAAEIK